MSKRTISGVSLKGVAAAVPKTVEDNTTLIELDEKSKKEIVEKVGIRFRRIAPENLTAADLCESAANMLIGELGWISSEIELLVFVSQTPDYVIPGSATQLQDRLRLDQNSIALDVNQGCSGYVYGLSVAASMMKSMGLKKGLLLVGDTITKTISKQDNSIWPIFSDAGSATALELDESEIEMEFLLGSMGADFEAIHIPEGGARNQLNKDSLQPDEIATGIARARNQLSMNGQAVFTFGLGTVSSEINNLLKESGTSSEDLDYLVMHQANQFLNDAIARKTGFSKNQTPSSLHNFGNTSCATIPVTLVTQLAKELQTNRLRMMLSGFGVGLSWGNVILSTNNVICPDLIEV